GAWGKRHESGTRILAAVQDGDYSVLYNLYIKEGEEKGYAQNWNRKFTQALSDSTGRTVNRIADGQGVNHPPPEDPVAKTLAAREHLIAYFLASHFEGIPLSLFLQWSHDLGKEYANSVTPNLVDVGAPRRYPSVSDETLKWCEIRTYPSDESGARIRFIGR